jgi:hypothetical protein
MALERLQAGIPIVFYSRLCRDPLQLFLLEKTPYHAASWTEHECGRIYLKRTLLYWPLVIHDESAGISN